MRRVAPLALVLALASCTSGTAKPTASGAPTPSEAAPSATSSPAPTSAGTSIVVAARRSKHEGLWLYRVGADRRAHAIGAVQPPAPGPYATDISLSAGPSPLLCTVWAQDDADDDATWCYDSADLKGWALPTEGDSYGVSLRPDGEAVAWEQEVDKHDQDASRDELVVAALDGRVARDQRVFVSQNAGDPPAGSRPLGCSDTAGWISWKDDDELLVQAWGENDFPGETFEHSVTSGPAGKEPPCRSVSERHGSTYNYFTQPVGFDDRTFLAVEGEYCEIECPGKREPLARRAVRVDLRTGRVLEVVATPAKGRFVSYVSGGRHGIAYTTYGAQVDRFYVRWPGEKHGVPITGLPADVSEVVAQP